MQQFSSDYDSSVVNYDRREFVRLDSEHCEIDNLNYIFLWHKSYFVPLQQN